MTGVLGAVLETGSRKVGTKPAWWEVWERGDEEGFKEQVTFQMSLESVVLSTCSFVH